jgi:RNA polymerase sigma-70 factor (ECF subfamily)
VTDDLILKVRAGDAAAFRQLTEPYRRELQVHCYRMLGSFHDAEEILQETLLAAWQGIGNFEGRASFRTWLYKIATNRCLNARRAVSRRPAIAWDVPQGDDLVPTRLGEVHWLEPFPDAVLDDAIDMPLGPEARYANTESISLSFVTALQLLPPRQLAVLVLRDVLGFEASEVARVLDSTLDSVNSALKRARASLQQRQLKADRPPPPALGSPAEEAIVAEFVRAYEATDLDALVALLTDDVFMSMPPMPFEYEGRELVARFWTTMMARGGQRILKPTRANGQPAFGSYTLTASGDYQGFGVVAIALSGDRICTVTRFEPGLLGLFGLPSSLPGRQRGALT